MDEYFTPKSLREDWEGMRRMRLMVGLSLLGLTLGGSYGVFYFAIGHYWGGAIIAVCIVLQVCVPFLIRTTGRIRTGGHLSLLVWGIGFTLLTAIEGGVHGFGIMWLVCGGPLLALLILERREALLWCAFFFCSTFVFAALEVAGVRIPPAYPEPWQPQIRAASVMGLVVFMSLMGILFEHARKEAVISMEEALTERERTEHAKRAAEGANQAKDQFLGVLSHELRTPLTPVLAAVTAMEAQEDLSPEARLDITMIRRNVELEAKLIEDLLDVTRISSGKLVLHPETVDAHSCLHSVMDICRADIEAKKLHLSTALEAERHDVNADPVRLRQVLWNLLNNAVKFTPPRGRISISTWNDAEKLRIQFTDTGVGIEPESLGRIFNAFEQGERTRTRIFGGLGLGLSIAKTVVEMHSGQLIAASEGKDKGATFTIELTVVAPARKAEAPCPSSKPKSGKLPRILFVEDDGDTRQILSKLLQRHGYEITSTDSVQGGLEVAAQKPFDIMVSDLGLPDGSGLDLMSRVKALYGIPGIALSGYGTEEDLRRSRVAGFDEHITKPVDFNTLHLAIQRITERCAERSVI